MALPVLAVLLIQICLATRELNHKHISLEGSPGIYYGELNPIHYEEDTWKVVIFLDLGRTAQENLLSQAFAEIDHTCPSGKKPGQCEGMKRIAEGVQRQTTRTQKNLEELREDLSEIIGAKEEPQTTTTDSKEREAPYAWIRQMTKVGFGVLTDNEGKYYATR